MLQEEADRWWRGAKRAMTAQAQGEPQYVSWEMFKKLFNEKYFPLSARIAKEREFMELKQT